MKLRIKSLVLPILVVMLAQLHAAEANAALISTQDMVQQSKGDQMREQLLDVFARSEVKEMLVQRGIDVANAEMRINALTDAEVASLHADIDKLPAGAGPGGVLVTVVLVLVILDVLGITNIFTFIRPQR